MTKEFDVWTNKFAYDIYMQKYSMNGQESWADTCKRVVDNVCGQHLSSEDKEKIYELMLTRKFIPGGRYLYSSGRPMHQVNNCLRGDTEIITKKGIFALKDLSGKKVTILNRYGKWEDGEVRSFGKQRLHRLKLSNDTYVEATLDHRWFNTKGEEETTATIQRIPFTHNKEVIELDEEGIRHGIVYGDGTVHLNHSHVCLIGENKQELINFFPQEEKIIEVGGGALRKYNTVRSIKTGYKAALQPVWYKNTPELNCTPEYARGFIAGLIATDGSTKTSTVTISCNKLSVAQHIAKIAVLGGCVVTGVRVAATVSPFDGSPRELCTIGIKPFSAPLIRADQIADKSNTRPQRMWLDVESRDMGVEEEVYCVTNTESGSFTLANGLTTGNCFLFRAEDSREGWADLMRKITASLMTGGGIGVEYSNLREEGALIKGSGGTSTGPISLMKMVNEAGRNIMQGGQRRSAIWAGLLWSHPDVTKFIHAKDWSEEVKKLKAADLNFPADLDSTNISVNYDTEFFVAIRDKSHPKHKIAKEVWEINCRQAFSTAEPGMGFNFLKDNESLRNACTEVVSEDDSDKCNLGTLWINRFSDKEDFREGVKYATKFLICGGIYSDVPIDEIKEVGLKNNRIGLGLGGMHEWLMQRGCKYVVTPELHKWLNIYERESDEAAFLTAADLHVAKPKGVRAIAPTGTIGILAETTTGIEPLFCKAYKRRYLKKDTWNFQYVVDGAVKRLQEQGVKVENIQDAYDISFRDRVKFQADVQQYVDMAISSTCNLPAWGSEENNETTLKKNARTLLKYAKRLRGFTCYPDGSRGGQPLTRVPLEEALKQEGVEFEEREHECVGGTCGI